MFKGLFKTGFLKDLTKVLEIFKDNKGRFSSKRTVAGVIVTIIATDATNLGEIKWIHVVMATIAASILILSPIVEKYNKDEYPEE